MMSGVNWDVQDILVAAILSNSVFLAVWKTEPVSSGLSQCLTCLRHTLSLFSQPTSYLTCALSLSIFLSLSISMSLSLSCSGTKCVMIMLTILES